MKYRSLYIVLFLLGGTLHISAAEPEKDKPDFLTEQVRKKKRVKMYQCLFDQENTYRMPEFVDRFFKSALIYNRNKSDRCDFYWDPNKPMDMKTAQECGLPGPQYLWMRLYNEKYEINFKELHYQAIQLMVDRDTDAATQVGVTLTFDPDEADDLILEITTVLDDKNTE